MLIRVQLLVSRVIEPTPNLESSKLEINAAVADDDQVTQIKLVY
ncbi:hypothetical protein AB0758_46285 [Tolypothrix bouteillei VB521301_2]